jgi:hypothetical protein
MRPRVSPERECLCRHSSNPAPTAGVKPWTGQRKPEGLGGNRTPRVRDGIRTIRRRARSPRSSSESVLHRWQLKDTDCGSNCELADPSHPDGEMAPDVLSDEDYANQDGLVHEAIHHLGSASSVLRLPRPSRRSFHVTC